MWKGLEMENSLAELRVEKRVHTMDSSLVWLMVDW